jgi:octanoyl-[GcvH]:protein N-octanoyltransferase
MNSAPAIRVLDTVAFPTSGDVLVPFSIDEAYARLANREKWRAPIAPDPMILA